MSRLCGMLFRPLDNYLRDEKDGAVQLVRKNIIPKVMAALLAPSLYTLAIIYSIGLTGYAMCAIYVLSVVVISLCHLLYFRHVTDSLIVFILFACSIATLFLDYLGVTSSSYRAWPLLVLVLDVSLIARVGEWVSNACVVSCALWLMVCMVEECTRIGFYDIGDPDYDQRKVFCDCEEPPCQRPWFSGIGQLAVTSLALGLDFLCTRSFCKKMLDEQEKMKQSVRAAEQIAGHLAAFDLEKADNLLGMAAAIPEDFRVVLEHLLQNLKTYEPFLPQSVLPLGDLGNDPDSASSCGTSAIVKSPDSKSIGSRSASGSVYSQNVRPTPYTPHDGPPTQIHSLAAVKSTDVSLRAVTLLAVNLADSLSLVGRSKNPQAFRDAQRTLLNASLRAAQEARGLVESFMGDRITSSWNASRTCVAHRDRAVSAACAVTEIMRSFTSRVTVHCAVASGEAWCGNMGTETFMRYNFVGAVYSFVHDLVRVATDWRMPILIDSRVQRDVATSYTTRVVLEPVVFPKRGDEKLTVLWEVTGANTGDVGEEWMYVVDSDDMRRNQQLNQLALAYLQNNEESFAEILPELYLQTRFPSPLDQRLERFLAYVRSPLPPCQRLPHRTDRLFPFSEEELGTKQTASPQVYISTSESP
ncbi:hypothetical protein DIPPA_02014 [Diplonema papillatum]|nr:hypothetical protein DIPPA_02014 [Diplonema papillatum]